MILKLIHLVASVLPKREIYAEDGKLYLERYRVFGWEPGSRWNGPSLYLHRFHLPDQDTALHNHPWKWAISLILAGGYIEDRVSGMRILRPGRLNIIRANDFHRVSFIRGRETWTLFLVAPKSRSWGFLTTAGNFIPWRERLAQRGIEVSE